MAKEVEKIVGKVTHYYPKIGVAIVELSAAVSAGDELHFKGKTTDFKEAVSSMQVEHANIESAKKGEVIGVKVSQPVREGDGVSKA
ncbi:MAG: translation elongation factor-like protein [Minisyncoccia bacterium]|jgi:putative protease